MTPTLGSAIRRRRIELGLTQEALAERIGDTVRQAEVSRLERGRVTLPRRDRLERIARALDLPLGELLAVSGWTGAGEAFSEEAAPEPAASRVAATADALAPTLHPSRSRLAKALEESRALQIKSAALRAEMRACWGWSDWLSPSSDAGLQLEPRTHDDRV